MLVTLLWMKSSTELCFTTLQKQKSICFQAFLLWLNGGPSCSSVGAGAFIEHGPFKPSKNVLVRNDYSIECEMRK
ncbi:serine carboxypeptidase-like 45 [Senna tora]|uniref:Serine carboxypeptidase-like 45 n=1 Tax=Senna tora TaxID=362788 RepID=A0A834X2B6_9FABA|nr:serine carboxypeptidase-like 45 [Senna tora]